MFALVDAGGLVWVPYDKGRISWRGRGVSVRAAGDR